MIFLYHTIAGIEEVPEQFLRTTSQWISRTLQWISDMVFDNRTEDEKKRDRIIRKYKWPIYKCNSTESNLESLTITPPENEPHFFTIHTHIQDSDHRFY